MESQILRDNNFKFEKKFGQNFIFDDNLLNAIVSDAKITKDDEILEVGAGMGTLTKILAQNAKLVVAYEIDKKLEPILNENLKDEKNVKLIFEDALKQKLEIIEQNFTKKYKIVANLPYYITTPLIFKFTLKTKNVLSLCIMVQKEVADRLVAKSKSKDYGITTIMLDFYGDVKLLRNVSRQMFMPIPNVDSAVVEIVFRKKYDCDENLFEKIVRGAFSMRRKTLSNNLSKCLNFNKQEIEKILVTCNFPTSVRAEELTTFDFVSLTNCISDIIRH